MAVTAAQISTAALPSRTPRQSPGLYFACHGSESFNVVPRGFKGCVIEGVGRVLVDGEYNSEANSFFVGGVNGSLEEIDTEVMQLGMANPDYYHGMPWFFDMTDHHAFGHYPAAWANATDDDIENSNRLYRGWSLAMRAAAAENNISIRIGKCGLPLPTFYPIYNYRRGIEAMARYNAGGSEADGWLNFAQRVGTKGVDNIWREDRGRPPASENDYAVDYYNFRMDHARLKYGKNGSRTLPSQGTYQAADLFAAEVYNFIDGTVDQFGVFARGVMEFARTNLVRKQTFAVMWPKLRASPNNPIDEQTWADMCDEVIHVAKNIVVWDAPRVPGSQVTSNHCAILAERCEAWARS